MTAWFSALVAAILQVLTDVGTGIFEFIKTGFVSLFCEVDSTTHAITGPSIIAYFAFAMLGLTLAISLTKYVTSLIRCKRSM